MRKLSVTGGTRSPQGQGLCCCCASCSEMTCGPVEFPRVRSALHTWANSFGGLQHIHCMNVAAWQSRLRGRSSSAADAGSRFLFSIVPLPFPAAYDSPRSGLVWRERDERVPT